MEQTPQPADKKAENTSRFGLSAMKVLALIILTVTSAGFAGYFIINPSVGYGIFSIVVFWPDFGDEQTERFYQGPVLEGYAYCAGERDFRGRPVCGDDLYFRYRPFG